MVYDQGAGYRSFLGADPAGARILMSSLRHACQLYEVFRSLADDGIARRRTVDLGRSASTGLMKAFLMVVQDLVPVQAAQLNLAVAASTAVSPTEVLHFQSRGFTPDARLGSLGDSRPHRPRTSPGEIVVLAPFLTDALRFSLGYRLEQFDVPVRSHRRRAHCATSLRQTLLTLAALIHPFRGSYLRSTIWPMP